MEAFVLSAGIDASGIVAVVHTGAVSSVALAAQRVHVLRLHCWLSAHAALSCCLQLCGPTL